MKMYFAVAACLLLSACATTQDVAVSTDTLQSMQGKSLVLVKSESPSFVAMTSGKGMFAVAGVGAAANAGNKLVRENNIEDPAITISRELAKSLAREYGLAVQGESDIVESGDVVNVINAANGSDYALDVTTHGWSYIYDDFKFGDYFVGYSSKLRLIDVKSGEVVSSGLCAYDAKQAGKSAVSHETLLMDNAAYIKKELADATSHCVDQFAGGLFNTQSYTP